MATVAYGVVIGAMLIISLAFLMSKSFFLAPTRLGWFMMLVNVPYEAFCRRWRKRWHVDLAALVAVGVAWDLAVGLEATAVWWLAFGLAWVHSLLADIRWQRGALTVQDARYPWQIPLPLPKLIVHVRGPVLSRGPVYALGAWPIGRTEEFEFIVLNPADKVHCQFPFHFEVTASNDAVRLEGCAAGDHAGLDPGELVRLPLKVRAARAGGATDIRFRLTLGSYVQAGVLRVSQVFDPTGVRVTGAAITRWKGGARAAWAWRGDTDLYDPATWQSADGVLPSFELSRRFRVPHSFFVSARLTLDENESAAHGRHFGLDRRSHQIPSFIEWMRRNLRFESEIDWPFDMSEGRYPCELANHFWLHYATHASADPGNNWQIWLYPGKGRYPWTTADGDSLIEQRDNAVKCTQTFQKLFGFTPTIWGIPGRGNDRNTPRAIEAAGLPCASDSDSGGFVHVFQMPPPHHPAGTQRLVELSRKYPGDPIHGNQLAMLKYWLGYARRHGRAMTVLAHHHLRGWQSASCYRMFEELLRDVLADRHGDFYVATMSAIGLYWERVLCPKHRWVAPTAGPGMGFHVSNSGDRDLEAVPVEVTFSNGARTLALVRIPAGGSVAVNWSAR